MNNLTRLRDGVAGVCCGDPWQLLHELSDMLLPGLLLLSLTVWLERRGKAEAAAPWPTPDNEVEALLPHFAELPLIAIDFPGFCNSRGCSLAYLLRVRLDQNGELCATDDVLRDQLSHMCQYSLDAFAVRGGENAEGALKELVGLNVLYDRSAIEP